MEKTIKVGDRVETPKGDHGVVLDVGPSFLISGEQQASVRLDRYTVPHMYLLRELRSIL